jgi:hypothetical protein
MTRASKIGGKKTMKARKPSQAKGRKATKTKPRLARNRARRRTPSAAGHETEVAQLKRKLKEALEQQAASAEILRTIATTPSEAGRSLRQIAETSARLFGAPSVSIQLTEQGEFTQEYRVGAIAQRIGSAYPRSNIRVGGRNMPGTVVFENRQIHIPDLDHLDPSMSDWPGLPHARAGGTAP